VNPRAEAQGGAGDCWLVEQFSELAAVRPGLVQQSIRDNGDDTFTVRFFGIKVGDQVVLPPLNGKLPEGERFPIEVTVDRMMPFRAGHLIYTNRLGSSYIWPEIWEKAAAKLYGSYEAIGNGGELATSIFLTTSWRAQVIDPKRYDLETLFGFFEHTLNHGGVALGGTPNDEPLRAWEGGHAYGFTEPTRIPYGPNRGRWVTGKNPWDMKPPSILRAGLYGTAPVRMAAVKLALDELAFAVPPGVPKLQGLPLV
jgi:hypothetical protein